MDPRSINRRHLLTLSAAAGATVCLSYRIPAADDIDPMSFILVSDTHLGRKDNESAERNWRKAVSECNAQPANFILHLGDVVDAGRKTQYPIYAETRKLLNKPIHEIPGNHDPLDLFTEYVAARSDRSIDYGGVRFILFNNSRRDSHLGFITDQQNQWLANQCNDAASKNLKIIICCHVPIHSNKAPDRGWYVKPADGQTGFYTTQQRHSDRILASFHGHFHNGIRGWRDHGQTVEALCPSVCYNQDRGLKDHIAEGKATGFVVDELRPGYVLLELGKGKLILRYKPLGERLNGEYTAAWS